MDGRLHGNTGVALCVSYKKKGCPSSHQFAYKSVTLSAIYSNSARSPRPLQAATNTSLLDGKAIDVFRYFYNQFASDIATINEFTRVTVIAGHSG